MVLRTRFFNPVTLVIAVVVVLALVIAVGSLGGSRMSPAEMPVSDASGPAGGEGFGYAASMATPMAVNEPAPSVAQEQQDDYGGVNDGLVIDEDGNVANGQDARTRVILKSASLRLVVDAADASLTAISNMAEAMGGWVVSSSTSMVTPASGEPVAQGSITIRVPSDKLDEALSQIKSGAGKVEYENVSGQDVTQQYVDLTSRLT